MRVIIFVVLIFNIPLLKSQKLELVSFKTQESYNGHCHEKYMYINSIKLNYDTLSFQLIIDDPMEYTPPRELSFNLENDTLFISYISNPYVRDTIVYNEETKKYDTLKWVSQTVTHAHTLENTCKIRFFEFSGLDKKPICIVYNNEACLMLE